LPTSSDVAIRLEGIGKQYRIGAQQDGYRTLREMLSDAAAAPYRRLVHLFQGGAAVAGQTETVWALDDISFEVKQGDVIGVIGRNGAGKSTLLKVLARITEPTKGHAEIHGRVGSLLEVGTGFHPELTGRENIYLNGAILGMGRREIDRKMDEIVAFAEVERFMDTPVKHYSSGMYLRLAFAVAAHLDTEVLLVDEVLAVGDAAFQRKCLGKMGGIAREGRTVLFVSHNMAAIESLCSRALVLDQGKVVYDGEASSAIHGYLTSQSEDLVLDGGLDALRSTPGPGILRALLVRDEANTARSTFAVGEPLTLEFSLDLPRAVKDLQIGVGVKNELGARVCTVAPRWSSTPLGAAGPGPVTVRCSLGEVLMMPGRYLLKVAVGDRQSDLEIIDDIPAFEIAPRDVWGGGSLPQPFSQGIIMLESRWSFEQGSSREAADMPVTVAGEGV